MLYMGVDLGGTGIKAGVVSENGEILSKGSTPTMKERPIRTSFATLRRFAKRWPGRRM